MNNKGFTLIELILVIAILGILAVSAMPSIFSLTDEANTAAEAGVAANVLAGITLYGAQQMASVGKESYPASLDSAANANCTTTNVCFGLVTKDGVNRDWKRNSDTEYVHINNNTTYTYNPVNGTFTRP